jgi:hypothetical protein
VLLTLKTLFRVQRTKACIFLSACYPYFAVFHFASEPSEAKPFVCLNYKKNLCALCAFFVLVVLPDFQNHVSCASNQGFVSNHSPFFLLDQKEIKNQGCRKIAKIYCMPLRRISILAAFVFQSAIALIYIKTLRRIFAA